MLREAEDPVEERERRTWRWIILILLVAAVAGLVAFALTRPAQVKVPDVTGQDVGTATQLLRDKGFEVETEGVFRTDPQAAVDEVFEQDPPAGEEVDEGSTIKLSYNRGPGTTEVPDVSGQEAKDARAVLEKAQFQVTTQSSFDDDVPEGRVIETSPPAGSSIQSGSRVTMVVSKGSDMVEVPDVTGLTDQQALKALDAADLAGTVAQRDDDAPEGEVVAQSPGPGKMVNRGASVTVFVSTGAVSVPDVVGELRKAAVTALKRAGFVVSISEQPTTDPAESNRVTNQFPPGGSRGRRGDTVTITVGVLQAAPPP